MKKIIEKANTEYALCRIPGLVITDKKSLIGYYECRDSYSDWANIDIKVIRSTNRGDSWKCVKIIENNGNTINNPVMIVDGATIHFLYCQNYKQIFYCKSEDDGKTFTEPTEISYALERGFFYNAIAVGPGHGIVHNGVLMAPIWIAYNEEDPKKHYPSFISTIYSKDGGKSWALGDRIEGEGVFSPNESALAVSSDDNVIISIRSRTEEKRRAIAKSSTGFNEWTEVKFAENLCDPWCMGSMTHIADTLFHINCDSEIERKNLTVKISRDDFHTCESILVDEEGGYSDIAVDGDEIYVLYERNVFHKTDVENNDGLYFTKIRYKD